MEIDIRHSSMSQNAIQLPVQISLGKYQSHEDFGAE
ncbi:uncharacterized, partial [Tachysurus ichikawai]